MSVNFNWDRNTPTVRVSEFPAASLLARVDGDDPTQDHIAQIAVDDIVQNAAAAATVGATNSALAADNSAAEAKAAAAIQNILATTPAALPYEVTAITGGIGTGTGGTNGEYALAVTSGPAGHEAYVTITAGAISSYRIANPGISTSNTPPTYSLSNVTGLTGATVPTATVTTIPVNRRFGAPSSDGMSMIVWQNVAGVLTQTTIPLQYTKNGVDAAVLASKLSITTRSGLGQDRKNLFNPSSTAVSTGYYLDATGTLYPNASYTTSAEIAVDPALTYRSKKAITVAFRNAAGSLVGTVIAIAADTPFNPPATAVSMRFHQTTSTLTKPRQMICPTTESIASWKYIAPFVEDTASAKRNSLASAVAVSRTYLQQGTQIFDQTACSDGALDQSNGNTTANASYSLTPFIPIDHVIPFSHNLAIMVGVYDYDQGYLGFYTPAVGTWDPRSTFPDACWIRGQLINSSKATYKLGYGTTPTSATFGYTSQATVDLTAIQKARAAAALGRADDDNVLNPTNIKYNTGVTNSNGGVYGVSNWSTTGKVEVNPTDYFSTTTGGNSVAYYDHNGVFTSTPVSGAAATFTASLTDNLLDVTVAPAAGLFIGQRISFAGYVPGNILRQMSGTTGGIGVYLMSARQGTPIASSAAFTAQVVLEAHTWTKVPAAPFYVQWQGNPRTVFDTACVKQGKTSQVEACVFTGDINDTTLTVSAITSGQLVVGYRIIGANMTTCTIIGLGTGTGGTGTYIVSVSQVITSQTMYGGISPVVSYRTYGGILTAVTKPYDSKKLVILGDSISYTAGYVPYILAGTGLALLANHSRPGRGMKDALYSYNGTTASPLTSANFTAADVVILNLGTNDWAGANTSLGVDLGTIADTTPDFSGAGGSSFYGDTFRALYQITQWNPTIRIFVATPLKRGDYTGTPEQPTYPGLNGTGRTLEQYVQALREVAEIFAAPIIDQFKFAGLNPYNITSVTGDGLHPSVTIAHQRQASVHIGAINAG